MGDRRFILPSKIIFRKVKRKTAFPKLLQIFFIFQSQLISPIVSPYAQIKFDESTGPMSRGNHMEKVGVKKGDMNAINFVQRDTKVQGSSGMVPSNTGMNHPLVRSPPASPPAIPFPNRYPHPIG